MTKTEEDYRQATTDGYNRLRRENPYLPSHDAYRWARHLARAETLEEWETRTGFLVTFEVEYDQDFGGDYLGRVVWERERRGLAWQEYERAEDVTAIAPSQNWDTRGSKLYWIPEDDWSRETLYREGRDAMNLGRAAARERADSMADDQRNRFLDRDRWIVLTAVVSMPMPFADPLELHRETLGGVELSDAYSEHAQYEEARDNGLLMEAEHYAGERRDALLSEMMAQQVMRGTFAD